MKSARRRAREFALQGVYAWLVAGQQADDIAAQIQASKGFDRADGAHFSLLLRGVIEQQRSLEQALEPCADRRIEALSPVERGVLLLAAFEMVNLPQVPFRVVINEAIELAKVFGGAEGHRFVNGVLDKLARTLRAQEAGSSV